MEAQVAAVRVRPLEELEAKGAQSTGKRELPQKLWGNCIYLDPFRRSVSAARMEVRGL